MNTEQIINTAISQDATQLINGVEKHGSDSPEYAALKAELEALKAQVAAKAQAKLSFKVSEKGAVSVYGNGRFPTTLYAEQWDRLLAVADDLKAFIKANRSKLAVKGQDNPDGGTRVDMSSGKKVN